MDVGRAEVEAVFLHLLSNMFHFIVIHVDIPHDP